MFRGLLIAREKKRGFGKIKQEVNKGLLWKRTKRKGIGRFEKVLP